MDNRNLGFLSFLRLVGTIYFKRHLASFACINQVETPDQLYHSIDDSLPPFEKHKEFIEKICIINGERIISEDERMPSITALYDIGGSLYVGLRLIFQDGDQI